MTKTPKKILSNQELCDFIYKFLDDKKAENLAMIPLVGKSQIADFLIFASGSSSRQVSAMADTLMRALKELGMKHVHIEGAEKADWVLVDAGAVIIHLFRPEVRTFYDLESMWDVPEGDNEKA